MFVRFRETPYGLQVSLIQTRREGGKARHEHIAGLGAITVPTSAADRIAFWRRLHDRLSALSNRIVDEQSKILGAVDERIPMPTARRTARRTAAERQGGSAVLGGAA